MFLLPLLQVLGSTHSCEGGQRALRPQAQQLTADPGEQGTCVFTSTCVSGPKIHTL